jgi:hypothetical protein
LIIPSTQLEEHIQMMGVLVVGKFSERVFNLDGFDSADWGDGEVMKVTVIAAVPKQDVYHAVSRCHRNCHRHCHHHVNILTCVSAVGDALTPILITGNPILESL